MRQHELGSDLRLTGKVWTAADGLPKTSGTIYAAVRLNKPGDTDHGKYWDDDDDSWQASGDVTTWPSTTHMVAGAHRVDVPSALLKLHGECVLDVLTDNMASPASQTTIDGALESAIIVRRLNQRAQDLIRDVIESQRGAHTHQGDEAFWVDPSNGDTIANGADGSRDNPLSTVTEALTLVSDSAHSVIFLVSGATGGATTLTEAVTLNKRYTFIRGPGRDFIWTRSGNGDTITVTADGCELSGFQVETAGTGVGNGIRVNGADFTCVRDLWVNDTQGSGVYLLDASHSVILGNHFESSGQSGAGHGLELDPTGGSVTDTQIRGNHFSDVAGDAIRMDAGTISDVVIESNEFHGSAGYGINNMGSATGVLAIKNAYADNASGETNGAMDRINDGDLRAGITTDHGAGDYDLAQSDILSDATPFAGANIDATISSRSDFDETADPVELLDSGGAAGTSAAELVADVQTTLDAAHGENSWEGGLVSGDSMVTLTIDDGTDPVVGATVRVHNSGNTGNPLRTETTNSDGEVTFSIDDGTYKVRVSKSGYSFTVPETLTVSGATVDTYSGVAGFTIPPPSTADVCVVFGTVRDGADNPIDDAAIAVYAITPQVAAGEQMGNPIIATTTNASGQFTIELKRQAEVQFTITKAGNTYRDSVLTVPDADSQDIATWT